jgi:predicted RNA-binding protein
VEIEGDEARLINIFGEQRVVKARIKSYDGTERKIVFESVV